MGKRKKSGVSEERKPEDVEMREEKDHEQEDNDRNPPSEKTLYEVGSDFFKNLFSLFDFDSNFF